MHGSKLVFTRLELFHSSTNKSNWFFQHYLYQFVLETSSFYLTSRKPRGIYIVSGNSSAKGLKQLACGSNALSQRQRIPVPYL